MPEGGIDYFRNHFRNGHLERIDDLPPFDPGIASALDVFVGNNDGNRQSLHWQRCFPEGTRVLLPDGCSASIESVSVDDVVAAPSGSARVVDVVRYEGLGELVTLYLRGADNISSTPPHEHLIVPREAVELPRGDRRRLSRCDIRRQFGHPELPLDASTARKRRADQIREGDWVVVAFLRDRKFSDKLDLTEFSVNEVRGGAKVLPSVVRFTPSLLRLFGLYLGDGSACYANGAVKWVFGENERYLAEEVSGTLLDVFGLESKIQKRSDADAWEVSAHSRRLVELFGTLLGGNGRPKLISSRVFHADVDLLPLVSGLLDADGSTQRGFRCTLVQSERHRDLLSQIRSILLDAGVWSTLSRVRSKDSFKRWRLYIPRWYMPRIYPGAPRRGCNAPRTLHLSDGSFAVRVDEVSKVSMAGTVWDLTVDTDDHLFCLESGAVTENSVRWVENILFMAGRHYIDDILTSRLVQNQSGDLALVSEAMRNIPRPTNDLLGRYVETNVALFTENRPIPRIEPKSDRAEDQAAAELSQLTIEYLWEALNLPHVHRQLARIVLSCGVCWLETIYDPTEPRRLGTPKMVAERESVSPESLPGVSVETPVERMVPLRDDDGNLVIDENLHFGDLRVNVVSPFEMYVPAVHRWDDAGWVMREYYASRDDLLDRYKTPGKTKVGLTKRNGWDLDVLEKSRTEDKLQNLPVWWWERLGQLVEGVGQTFYVGNPEMWKDYVVVRVFDRRPNSKWPKGRTIITVGDKVLYDSPKKRGARAFHPKWPTRWHPYTIYRWEPLPSTDIWCRSLVNKLLPKLKRVNSIDTTEIMYRRTVPVAAWIVPRGTTVAEDMWTGKPGPMLEYDVRRTGNAKPEPVFPQAFPEAILVERQQQIQEMEVIAGTEEILRGQRPTGVNCWVEGSELTDADGLPVAVREIRVGDAHVSMKGTGLVGACHAREYEGPVVTVRSWGNLPMTVTPHHKFPVIPKEALPRKRGGTRKQDNNTGGCLPPAPDAIERREAAELRPGDLVLSGFHRNRDGIDKLDVEAFGGCFKGKTRGVPLPPYVSLDDDFLWLCGLYLAEGCIVFASSDGEPSEVRWTLHSSEASTLGSGVVKSVQSSFGLHASMRERRETSGVDVCVSNRALARLFLNLFGHGSREKRIHPELFRTPHSLLPMVAGWMDGDGNQDGNAVRVATFSKPLASQMRSILLDAQVYAGVSSEPSWPRWILRASGEDAAEVVQYSARFCSSSFRPARRGRRGFWFGPYYASYVASATAQFYRGRVYNVTMDERTGRCDNTVNVYGAYSCQSAMMIDVLRKQALASKSAILQGWDESMQHLGSSMVQEVIKNIDNDPLYAERIRILARQKRSRLTIRNFSGADLSDNVDVRVDTASQALVSKEAREAKAIEFIRYAGSFMSIPEPGLRNALVEELGFDKALKPQGSDYERVKKMISWVLNEQYDRVIPLPEDDPYIFHDLLVQEYKAETFWDLKREQQELIIKLIDAYRDAIQAREEQRLRMMVLMAQLQNGLKGGQGGDPFGGEGALGGGGS